MGMMTAIAISQMEGYVRRIKNALNGYFYPPHTLKFAPLCAKVIEVYVENIFEIDEGDLSSLEKQKYKIPDEVKFRGRDYMTLQEVLESFKLDPWIISIVGEEE